MDTKVQSRLWSRLVKILRVGPAEKSKNEARELKGNLSK